MRNKSEIKKKSSKARKYALNYFSEKNVLQIINEYINDNDQKKQY